MHQINERVRQKTFGIGLRASLLSIAPHPIVAKMLPPTQAVRLEVDQVEDLARHLSSFRHDVNGCLSLIVAATELIRYNPDVVKRMAATLVEQPPRVAGKTREFVQECERVLGMRSTTEPSWYRSAWKRYNVGVSEPTAAIPIAPETGRNLHAELLNCGKEIMQTGFMVSGAAVLAAAAPGSQANSAVLDQFTKLVSKFDQFASRFEAALNLQAPAVKKLGSGSPTGPVTISTEKATLFHRKLINLERDVMEHLQPLLELSRLAQKEPRQVQARASEFAEYPPKVSALVTEFASQFDETFAIVRLGTVG
jgi:hypothetical protein